MKLISLEMGLNSRVLWPFICGVKYRFYVWCQVPFLCVVSSTVSMCGVKYRFYVWCQVPFLCVVSSTVSMCGVKYRFYVWCQVPFLLFGYETRVHCAWCCITGRQMPNENQPISMWPSQLIQLWNKDHSMTDMWIWFSDLYFVNASHTGGLTSTISMHLAVETTLSWWTSQRTESKPLFVVTISTLLGYRFLKAESNHALYTHCFRAIACWKDMTPSREIELTILARYHTTSTIALVR